VGGCGISSLNRSARASRQILIGINTAIHNYILRIDSKKNTRLRKLKCGMWGTPKDATEPIRPPRIVPATGSRTTGAGKPANSSSRRISCSALLIFKPARPASPRPPACACAGARTGGAREPHALDLSC
jgi:hypothetical protein